MLSTVKTAVDIIREAVVDFFVGLAVLTANDRLQTSKLTFRLKASRLVLAFVVVGAIAFLGGRSIGTSAPPPPPPAAVNPDVEIESGLEPSLRLLCTPLHSSNRSTGTDSIAAGDDAGHSGPSPWSLTLTVRTPVTLIVNWSCRDLIERFNIGF
jgi:hypothetical protein